MERCLVVVEWSPVNNRGSVWIGEMDEYMGVRVGIDGIGVVSDVDTDRVYIKWYNVGMC